MDPELKDMLVKLLEGQNKLETEVSGIKTEVVGIKEDVKRNSIKLETIEKHISIIAEVQTAHKEQNIRGFEKSDNLITEKTDLIEKAVTNVSKDVKEIILSVDVLKDMTGRHEVDINILKRRPV